MRAAIYLSNPTEKIAANDLVFFLKIYSKSQRFSQITTNLLNSASLPTKLLWKLTKGKVSDKSQGRIGSITNEASSTGVNSLGGFNLRGRADLATVSLD